MPMALWCDHCFGTSNRNKCGDNILNISKVYLTQKWISAIYITYETAFDSCWGVSSVADC